MAACLAVGLLAACASTPDPAEICTVEWIAPRADRAVERIETRLDRTFEELAAASESWLAGRSPGPIQLYKLSNAAKALERELTDGRGIQDLRTLASTCNDPDLIRSELLAILDRQNIPDGVVRFLDGTGLLDRILRTAEGARES
ncbi:MAG: hypothetical protein WBG08_07290 [Litorimonas sp.]